MAIYQNPKSGSPLKVIASVTNVVNQVEESNLRAVTSGAVYDALETKQDKLVNPLTKSDVVNNLNTTTTNLPLSANMGKKLQDEKASKDVATTSTDGLMSSTDKSKLDGIESGAEANVQSDWNQTTTTADNYIKNKPTKLSDFTNDSGFIKNTVNNLTNYYLKTDTYTKTEVNGLISSIVTLNIEVVSSLPTTDISQTTIYLVPKATSQTNNVYDEYINTDGTTAGWEKIGDTEVDLSNYYTITQVDNLLANKVDKVSGKGLSTNDFTTTLKNKLDGIEANANNYSLPTASANTKGGVKIGSNLSMSGDTLNATDTTYSNATTSASGLMSSSDKTKLNGIAENANNYSLPTASATTKGGIKIGSNLSMSGEVLNATDTTYGVVSKTTNGLCPQLPNETSTTKFLRQDGTWDVPSGTSAGSVTSVATGVGLTGGTITTSGTIKAKLKSETALTADSANATETSGRIYAIQPDKSGNLAVVVPWTDNNTTTGTTYTAGNVPANTTFGTNGSIKNAYDDCISKEVASITRSGTTFTAKNSSGTQLFTFTQQDNNTTTGDGITTKVAKTGSGTTVTSTISASTTMDNAIGTLLNNDVALNSNKQPKTLATARTLGGTQYTTVESLLGAIVDLLNNTAYWKEKT